MVKAFPEMTMAMKRLIWAALIGILLTPAVARAQAEEVVYFHTDAIGSVRMITDSSGTVLARYDYTPFGQTSNPPGTVEEVMQFTGKEREVQTELDYFIARDFMSLTGRFTTVDPAHVNGDISDPQSWNAYAYARNNPLKFTDPTGTTYEICGFIGSIGGGCGRVSDVEFGILQANPGLGISLSGNVIYAGGQAAGFYRQISVDATMHGFIRQTADLSAAALTYGSVGLGAAAGAGALAGAGAIAIGSSAIGVTADVLFGGMGPSMAVAISQVSNPRLQRALSALYQVTDRLRGGTAAAAQFTRDRGILVGGSDHATKAGESVARLQNILRRESLTSSDRQLAEYALRQLQRR